MSTGRVATHARRWIPAAGAVLAAAGVAVWAIAAHAADGADAARLAQAGQQWLLHGVALLAFAGGAGRLRLLASAAWLAGMLLFGGSLVLAVALGTSTALAPLGGMALMLGWLLAALALLQRSSGGGDDSGVR